MRRFTARGMAISELLVDEAIENCRALDQMQKHFALSDRDLEDCIESQVNDKEGNEGLIKRVADVYEAMVGVTLLASQFDLTVINTTSPIIVDQSLRLSGK